MTAEVSVTDDVPIADLTGHRALVTGAASGIGRACAEAFAAAAAELLVLDRDAEGAKRVPDAVGRHPLVADLDDPTMVANLPPDRVDVVSNTGVLHHVAGVPECGPAVFTSKLRVRVETPFAWARAVLPHIQQRPCGRFVHISS